MAAWKERNLRAWSACQSRERRGGGVLTCPAMCMSVGGLGGSEQQLESAVSLRGASDTVWVSVTCPVIMTFDDVDEERSSDGRWKLQPRLACEAQYVGGCSAAS